MFEKRVPFNKLKLYNSVSDFVQSEFINQIVCFGGGLFMFQKAIIIGCPGAGKSTFARILSDKTHLPLYYLDMLWHKPDRTTVDRNIFDKKLKEIVLRDKWIIDGNYGRTLEMRIQACERIFLLDFPVEECLAGAESRIGRQRVDMPWIETEFDEEFRQWIIDFPKNELPIIYKLLDRYKSEKSIYIFRSRADIDDYLLKMSC